MKKLLLGTVFFLTTVSVYGQFAPNTILTAAQLNAALARPTIVGGSIDGTPVGGSIPSTGLFTTLQASVPVGSSSGGTNSRYFSVAGPTTARTYTFPDANITVARIDAAQTFTGVQTFAGDAQLTTLTATGQTSLGGAFGAEGLRVVPVTSAVNRVEAVGAAAFGSVAIQSAGSNSDINLHLASKGNSSVSIWTGGNGNHAGIAVYDDPNAVNWLMIKEGATGIPLTISSQGDANAELKLTTSGNGNISLTPAGTGLVKISGGVYYNSLHSSNTAPTLSGFGTSPSLPSNNGTAAFSINVGSGGIASTGTITLPTAAHNWICSFVDTTNPATAVTSQTGGTATTITLTNYSRVTGLATAWAANDVLFAMCAAF